MMQGMGVASGPADGYMMAQPAAAPMVALLAERRDDARAMPAAAPAPQPQPMAPPPPAQGALPAGWDQRDAGDGRMYYENHFTKTTQWERPTAPAQATPPPTAVVPAGWDVRRGGGPAGSVDCARRRHILKIAAARGRPTAPAYLR